MMWSPNANSAHERLEVCPSPISVHLHCVGHCVWDSCRVTQRGFHFFSPSRLFCVSVIFVSLRFVTALMFVEYVFCVIPHPCVNFTGGFSDVFGKNSCLSCAFSQSTETVLETNTIVTPRLLVPRCLYRKLSVVLPARYHCPSFLSSLFFSKCHSPHVSPFSLPETPTKQSTTL